MSHTDEAKGLRRAAKEARRIADAVVYSDALSSCDRLIQIAEWCENEAEIKDEQQLEQRPKLVTPLKQTEQ